MALLVRKLFMFDDHLFFHSGQFGAHAGFNRKKGGSGKSRKRRQAVNNDLRYTVYPAESCSDRVIDVWLERRRDTADRRALCAAGGQSRRLRAYDTRTSIGRRERDLVSSGRGISIKA